MKELSLIRQNSVSAINFLNDSLENYRQGGAVENKQAVYDFINVVNSNEISRLTNLITNENLVLFMPRKAFFIAQNFKVSLQKIGINCKLKILEDCLENDFKKLEAGTVSIFSDVLAKEKISSQTMELLKKNHVIIVKIQDEVIDMHLANADVSLYTVSSKMKAAVNENLQLQCLGVLMDCIYINLLLKTNIN